LQQTAVIPVDCLSSAESYMERAIGVDKIGKFFMGNFLEKFESSKFLV
jgi:hypothetical protein